MDGFREWECQFMCIVFGCWIKTWFRLGSLVISYKQSIGLWHVLSTFIKLIQTYLHKLTYVLNGLLNQQTCAEGNFFIWCHKVIWMSSCLYKFILFNINLSMHNFLSGIFFHWNDNAAACTRTHECCGLHLMR